MYSLVVQRRRVHLKIIKLYIIRLKFVTIFYKTKMSHCSQRATIVVLCSIIRRWPNTKYTVLSIHYYAEWLLDVKISNQFFVTLVPIWHLSYSTGQDLMLSDGPQSGSVTTPVHPPNWPTSQQPGIKLASSLSIYLKNTNPTAQTMF